MVLNPVDKEKPTQQPSLHGHRTLSSPKQQLTRNKDKTEEPWNTVPVQNQSNGADPSAPHHPTGALPTVAAGAVAVAGAPGEKGCLCLSLELSWVAAGIQRSEGSVLPGSETGLPLATAAKKMLWNSAKPRDKQTCQAASHYPDSENLPQATFLAA